VQEIIAVVKLWLVTQYTKFSLKKRKVSSHYKVSLSSGTFPNSNFVQFVQPQIENSVPGRLKFSKIHEFYDIFKIQ